MMKRTLLVTFAALILAQSEEDDYEVRRARIERVDEAEF